MNKKILIVGAVILLIGIFLAAGGAVSSHFDFSSLRPSSGEKYEKKGLATDEHVDYIKISDVDCDIRFVKSDRTIVECYDSKKIYHAISCVNGVLTVKRVDNTRWYERTWFGWDDDVDRTVTVFLPAGDYESVDIVTVSGDIYIPDGFSFKDASMKTTSGEIQSLVDAKKCSIHTTTGDIYAENLNGSETNIVSTSGGVKLYNISAGSITLRTTSGDINLVDARSSGKTDITTTSGKIGFDMFFSDGGLSIKTTSGDVSGTISGNMHYSLSTASGDIRVPEDYGPSAPLCEIKTTSGDIHIKTAE